MRKVLLLGVVLAVFQQWCGINVIFNYAEEIFNAAGYDISDVLKNIAWTGSVNLAFTFVALGVVDRGGRRPLMLFGAAGLAVIYIGDGLLLSRRRAGPAAAAAGAGGHRLLLHVAGAGDVGRDFGNFPEPHSRRGHVRRGDGAMDCLFHPDLHLSDAEQEARPGRHVLALRRRFASRVLCSSCCACPKPRAKPWKKSRRNWWIEPGRGGRVGEPGFRGLLKGYGLKLNPITYRNNRID